MTEREAVILDSWVDALHRAIRNGEDDAAYALLRGFLLRLREAKLLPSHFTALATQPAATDRARLANTLVRLAESPTLRMVRADREDLWAAAAALRETP